MEPRPPRRPRAVETIAPEDMTELDELYARLEQLEQRRGQPSQALVAPRPTIGPMPAMLQRRERNELVWTDEQRKIIKDQYAPNTSDLEFAALMAVAAAKRLNPLTGQIHFVSRNVKVNDRGQERWEKRWSTQTGIDGFRAIAEDTGLYDGQDEPELLYEPVLDTKGQPTGKQNLIGARVCVYRKDWSRPSVGVAYFDEYAQKTEGRLTAMWAGKPRLMIAKCAEALAFRKAFPQELGGLHIREEFNDDDGEPTGAAATAHHLSGPRVTADTTAKPAPKQQQQAQPPKQQPKQGNGPQPLPPPSANDTLAVALERLARTPRTGQALDEFAAYAADLRLTSVERKRLLEAYNAAREEAKQAGEQRGNRQVDQQEPEGEKPPGERKAQTPADQHPNAPPPEGDTPTPAEDSQWERQPGEDG